VYLKKAAEDGSGTHNTIAILPHYHITTLPHYHITTLPHYHITTLPHYHINTRIVWQTGHHQRGQTRLLTCFPSSSCTICDNTSRYGPVCARNDHRAQEEREKEREKKKEKRPLKRGFQANNCIAQLYTQHNCSVGYPTQLYTQHNCIPNTIVHPTTRTTDIHGMFALAIHMPRTVGLTKAHGRHVPQLPPTLSKNRLHQWRGGGRIMGQRSGRRRSGRRRSGRRRSGRRRSGRRRSGRGRGRQVAKTIDFDRWTCGDQTSVGSVHVGGAVLFFVRHRQAQGFRPGRHLSRGVQQMPRLPQPCSQCGRGGHTTTAVVPLQDGQVTVHVAVEQVQHGNATP
jgi:hypothetical protein